MSGTRKLLSVVIPCFNAGRWIDAALHSILSQGDERVEVIVVNDGSTDNTRPILANYASKVVILDQPNCGVSAARNAGLARSTGAYVRFLDADDVVCSVLVELVDALSARPGAVLVGRSRMIDETGNILDSDAYNLPPLFNDGQAILPEYLFTQPTSSCLWVIPRETALASGGFDPTIRLGEEFSFTRSLMNTGAAFFFLDKVLSHVRRHDGPRLSSVASEADYLAQLALMKECQDDLARIGRWSDPSAVYRVATMAWSLGRQCYRLGYDTAGSGYVAYSRQIAGNKAAAGSAIYKALAGHVDVRRLETTMTWAKRILRYKSKAVSL